MQIHNIVETNKTKIDAKIADMQSSRRQPQLHGQNMLIHAQDQEHAGITGGEKNVSISHILSSILTIIIKRKFV
jgi:hypothetical protein